MLTPDQVDDFVTTTLSLFKRHKWTDIALELQDYPSSMLLDTKKVIEAGGRDISFRLKTRNTGSAINTGLFAQDNVRVEDVMQSASVPWAKQTANFAYDVDEDLFQSDQETIVRELVIRDHGMLSDLAELHEENFWSKPTDSTDTRPMGVPYWIVKDATTTVGGAFNGGNPSGFTSGAGGLSSTTYPRWRNWTFGYTSVSGDDLVVKLKKSMTFCTFRAPVPHPTLGFGKADWAMYTTYRVTEPLERLAESRNDNHKNDVARYMNDVVVGGVPIKWVPYLEANDTSDPVYGINWAKFRPYVKSGANMRRSKPERAAKQHTVREVHIDNWMNYICYDRRSLFVGSKS